MTIVVNPVTTRDIGREEQGSVRKCCSNIKKETLMDPAWVDVDAANARNASILCSDSRGP